MAEINIVNSGISGSSGSTDLTGFGFSDNPIISNYISRDSFPSNVVDTAVPFGSQENFSLKFLSASSQYVEGNMDPVDEDIIDGGDYTFATWIRFDAADIATLILDLGVGAAGYREAINSRFVGAGTPGTYSTLNAAGAEQGFSIGVVESGGDLFWAFNINGEDFDDGGGTAIAVNTWYWIVLRKEADSAKLYAVTDVIGAGPTALIDTGPAGLTLGPGADISGNIKFGHSDSGPSYWNMSTMGTQLWASALTGSQIQDVQYTILIPAQAELVGLRYYYRFNPDFNNIVKDANHGKNNFYLKNFEGNPFLLDSPTAMGDPNLRCLDFAGTDEYLIRYDNSNNDVPADLTAPGLMYKFNSSFTFEGWVKFDTLPNLAGETMGLFSKWDTTASKGFKFDVRYLTTIPDGVTANGAYFVFQLDGGVGGGADDAVTYIFDDAAEINVLSTGVWYYFGIVKDVTGTMNGGTKNYHFWAYDEDSGDEIDDDTSSAFTIVGGDVYQSDVNMLVGATHLVGVPDRFLDGKMIMFRCFKTIRTQSEIAAYRNQFINF